MLCICVARYAVSDQRRKKERIPHLLLAVALDRRSTSRRVPPLNHLSSPYTLTSHKGQCMSNAISMHRSSDPRQTASSDLSKIIPCLVAPRFEHSTLILRAKQHSHSAIVAPDQRNCIFHERCVAHIDCMEILSRKLRI